jgi:hypothetical protein
MNRYNLKCYYCKKFCKPDNAIEIYTLDMYGADCDVEFTCDKCKEPENNISILKYSINYEGFNYA